MKNWQAKALRAYLLHNVELENRIVRTISIIFFVIGLVFPWAFLYPETFLSFPILNVVHTWSVWVAFGLPFALSFGVPFILLTILNLKALE